MSYTHAYIHPYAWHVFIHTYIHITPRQPVCVCVRERERAQKIYPSVTYDTNATEFKSSNRYHQNFNLL